MDQKDTIIANKVLNNAETKNLDFTMYLATMLKNYWRIPFLSGNTKNSIHAEIDSVIIDPFPYNFKVWRENHVITSYRGRKTSYAKKVNYITGGFSGRRLNWVENCLESNKYTLAYVAETLFYGNSELLYDEGDSEDD